MAEKKRTTAEIRAYCKRLPRILQDVPACVNNVKSYRYGAYRAFAEMARTDLPRVLDAAVALWRARYADRDMMLRQSVARLAKSDNMTFSEEEIRQLVLDDQLLSRTAWLSPEPALSPSGENEEGDG